MQKHNEHKNYDAQQIRRLIGRLNEESLPADVRAEINRLLLDERYEEQVREALTDVWEASNNEEFSDEYRTGQIRITMEGMVRKSPDISEILNQPTARMVKPLYRRIGFRVAAVIPLLLIAGAITLSLNTDTMENDGFIAQLSEYQTTDGELEPLTFTAIDDSMSLILPDGSTIRLDKGAEVEYGHDFLENRVVTLHGDAFFSVAKMDGKPFEVHHTDKTIRVLGTEFYVREIDASTEVTLCTGSVEIAHAGQMIRLEPNQQFVTDLGGEEYTVIELSRAQIARIQRGKLEFNEISLDEALMMTGEFFDVEINVGRVSGTVRFSCSVHDTLEDVLFMLQIASGNAFDYTIEEDKVTIQAR